MSSNEKNVNSNEKPLSFASIFAYGSGNFASQLSWTMVSTYLILFYTNAAGIAAGAVALIMLIVRIWDAIFDPIIGGIMERTHTKWGRFRPYILFGAPFLVVLTILTFTVPDFSSTGKIIYAFVTYLLLSMCYSVVNVPYLSLPGVMSRDGNEINRLYAAQMLGMTIGMIALNLCTLPLVQYFGNGVESVGYQRTAGIFALVSLPIFFLVFKTSREVVTVKKENALPVKEAAKLIVKNKPLILATIYTIVSMIGMFGRLGVAVFYYMFVVGRFDLITLFMMMQVIVGTIIMPFSPKVIRKIGKKNTAILAMVLQTLAMLMIFFGDPTNIPFLIASHVVYGLGYISGPCGSSMTVDSIDFGEWKYGGRPDGTAFAMQVLGTKVASAVGASLGIFIIGLFGFVAGQPVTPEIARGINISVNLVPAACFILALIPLLMYNLPESKVEEIRKELKIRHGEHAE
ncbi:sugar (glycoside-pentoside-hexuronide) transporter [Clostridium saccharoperbutylacetonicum]|uniref:Sugar (Glycoside-pentoside-hexuronide) transporter n=1 Tax=Clostridium saccharoperbutylacetonicum N1-4(HMT) TaxID=931276 RepID=M1MKP9_9CLOT|nr:glycoside-pentoside-hexuronide (GPH):cation symporter [Clostridium saccharoperbutylacetonicum]AGF58519.1 sugar (glycoside-pentoside-hexuronide) transporter [Clostridium saccharoperbutylacetonicum N1-4(HMT)]NRT60703.1 sugar (glycoside-pentoside-hexuronide) transporter [Clostridium saccharoperbutylacetonicum]NSB24017.1 sugar (glycoside-pentoside-hexuronide) transporter [Clostridium saccharoperbutylacetonicum]NSB43394.1 sugar (glycoside-pentoside-hexuronide) transporter [Clostridium saccharoper